MKSLKFLQILVLTLAIGVLLGACGESNTSAEHDAHTEEPAGHDHDASHGHDHDAEHAHDQDAAAHGEGTAYTAAYVCPMHCEGSGSESPGTCPVCNMDYVAQADHVSDGHKHE